jgi:hypothetical protein
MKYIRLFVALLAACMLVTPAFSMPNTDNQMKDGKAKIDAPCQNSFASDLSGVQQPCDCKKALSEQVPKMGQDGNNGPQSMMGGMQQNPCCQNAKMGQDGNNGPQSMMDNTVQK